MVHIVSVMLAPLEEAPSEQDEDVQALKEHMTVQERQEKLLEKLNLNGLSEWTPHNAAIARELLLSYHDAFALEPDELGCTSAIEHEIRLSDDEPFKEHFRHIPPPLLEEVRASLRDMLELVPFDLVSLLGAMPWCWCGRRMGLFDFALISGDSTCMDQEGFLSSPQDTRGAGEHGRSCTLLHYGLQEWILAGLHGPGVTAVYHVHGQQPRFL